MEILFVGAVREPPLGVFGDKPGRRVNRFPRKIHLKEGRVIS